MREQFEYHLLVIFCAFGRLCHALGRNLGCRYTGIRSPTKGQNTSKFYCAAHAPGVYAAAHRSPYLYLTGAPQATLTLYVTVTLNNEERITGTRQVGIGQSIIQRSTHLQALTGPSG